MANFLNQVFNWLGRNDELGPTGFVGDLSVPAYKYPGEVGPTGFVGDLSNNHYLYQYPSDFSIGFDWMFKVNQDGSHVLKDEYKQ